MLINSCFLTIYAFSSKKGHKIFVGKGDIPYFCTRFREESLLQEDRGKIFLGGCSFFYLFQTNGFDKKKDFFPKKDSKRFGSNKNLFLSLQPVTDSVIG